MSEDSWNPTEDLEEVLSVIRKAVKTSFEKNYNADPETEWSWNKNSRCKYISIRVDMRDGDFVLTDRDDQVINIEELKKQ